MKVYIRIKGRRELIVEAASITVESDNGGEFNINESRTGNGIEVYSLNPGSIRIVPINSNGLILSGDGRAERIEPK